MTKLVRSSNLKRFIQSLQNSNGLENYEDFHAWSIKNKDQFWSHLSQELGLQVDSFWGALSQPLIERASNGEVAFYILEQGRLKNLYARELLEDIRKISSALLERVEPGRRAIVHYSGDNPRTAIILYLSTLKCGFDWIATSPDLGDDILRSLYASHRNSLFLSIMEHDSEVTAPNKIEMSFEALINFNLNKWNNKLSGNIANSRLLMLTSGSTGYPKLVGHGPETLLNQAKEHFLHLDIQKNDKVLFLTHPAWMMWNWTIATILSGAVPVLCDPKSLLLGKQAWFEIGEIDIDLFGISTFLCSRLPTILGTTSSRIRTKKVVLTGGPVNTTLIRQLNRICQYPARDDVFSISGGTEVNGCFFIETLDHSKVDGYFQCAGLGIEILMTEKPDIELNLQVKSEIPNRPVLMVDIKGDNILDRYVDSKEGIISHPDIIRRTKFGYEILVRSELIFKVNGQRISLLLLYNILEGEHVDFAVALPVVIQEEEKFVLIHTPLYPDRSLNDLKSTVVQRLGASYLPELYFEVPYMPMTPSGKKNEGFFRRMLTGQGFSSVNDIQNILLSINSEAAQ